MRHQNHEALSFYELNKPVTRAHSSNDVACMLIPPIQHAEEAEIDALMKDIVDSIFSVLVTLSVVPIIRCSRRYSSEAFMA